MKAGHRIVLVEFAGSKPFSVVTMNEEGHYDHYDFEWCKRDGIMFYHNSSNSLYLEGGNSTYWADDAVVSELRDGGGKKPTGKRLKKMPKKWPLGRLFDDGYESDAIWCRKCKDFLPTSDGDALCDHVRWCDSCGWWSGEGSDEPCEHGKGR